LVHDSLHDPVANGETGARPLDGFEVAEPGLGLVEEGLEGGRARKGRATGRVNSSDGYKACLQLTLVRSRPDARQGFLVFELAHCP